MYIYIYTYIHIHINIYIYTYTYTGAAESVSDELFTKSWEIWGPISFPMRHIKNNVGVARRRQSACASRRVTTGWPNWGYPHQQSEGALLSKRCLECKKWHVCERHFPNDS